jgi:hypothetical protein
MRHPIGLRIAALGEKYGQRFCWTAAEEPNPESFNTVLAGDGDVVYRLGEKSCERPVLRASVGFNSWHFLLFGLAGSWEAFRLWRESPAWFRRCSGRSVGRLHFGRIHPVRLKRPGAVNLHDRLAFAHREMPHFLGQRNKIADVHRSQLRFIEVFPHAYQQSALQYGDVFIRRMPVRGDFCSVGASQT